MEEESLSVLLEVSSPVVAVSGDVLAETSTAGWSILSSPAFRAFRACHTMSIQQTLIM